MAKQVVNQEKLYGTVVDGLAALRKLHSGLDCELNRPLVRFLTTPSTANDIGEVRSAADVRHKLGSITRHKAYFPSPAHWEDEVLYFLLLDRFSDGYEVGYRNNEGVMVEGTGTPRYQPGHVSTKPVQAKHRWLGGTLQGAASKLGYLRRLGVTAIWLSPIFRQAANADSYHGYGIQNFLDIDPRFAPGADTPEARRKVLRNFVEQAHSLNIRVILDIVLNHTGNVFEYVPDRYSTENGGLDPRWDGRPYPVKGFYDRDGNPALSFEPVHHDQWPDGAIWPLELQDLSAFTRRGRIRNWDYFPEYLDGDFYVLKNLNLGTDVQGKFRPSQALVALTEAYRFWMADADIDGFRLDTVKHIEMGAARYFASAIHEFGQCLGKENFYIIGEITGGRAQAFQTLEYTGLDAALGLDEVPTRFEQMMRGDCDPKEYFKLFRNSQLLNKESQLWFNSRIVTMYNDHDMVGRPQARLCHHYEDPESRSRIALQALALNVTTMGIPCIYYGSEQCFDGAGSDHDLRQTMFGGGFGAFGVTDAHFFDEDTFVYTKLRELLRLRDGTMALRRGRQYLRETSGDGRHFGLPTGFGGPVRGIVAWSRIFDEEEVVLSLNTDLHESKEVLVVVDAQINARGQAFVCEYDNLVDTIGELPLAQKQTILPEIHASGRMCLRLRLKPCQFMVWSKPGVVMRRSMDRWEGP